MTSDLTNRKRKSAAGQSLYGLGIAQLTLVEHSLCQLDPGLSLKPKQRHESEFFYTDKTRRRRRGRVVIDCAKGLLANDEFFLWGLLALTLSQPNPDICFFATPHFCLRRLGLVDTKSNRGGKNYALFRAALERLAAVNYYSDAFYDPIRREHCETSFGFLSYRLPIEEKSSRAWRIYWNPVFFEMCAPFNGHLPFDLETYRELDQASRRLFLLLKKVFWRCRVSHVFDVRDLAVNALGYSPKLNSKTLNRKVKTCAGRLVERGIVALPPGTGCADELVVRQSTGKFAIQFHRGDYFQKRNQRPKFASDEDLPVFDTLQAIGLEKYTVRRVLRQYDHRLIQEWADITLAAPERFGREFFKASPQAFFMDNIRKARDDGRMPPDWWRELRKTEESRAENELWTRLAPVIGGRKSDKNAADRGMARVSDLLT